MSIGSDIDNPVHGAGTGNIVGPNSSTDTAVAIWSGADGDELADSNVLIDGSANIAAPRNFKSTLASKTLVLKQGANGKCGTVTLNGVTPVTVNNTSITANSVIIFTLKTVGGTVGAYPAIQTITASTGFTVSGTALDTSVYNYAVIESAA